MPEPIRWGILGTGDVAGQMAADLRHVDGTVLAAVASRDADRARAFGTHVGALSHYGSYEALASANDIDVVYVATPNTSHCDNVLLLASHGKSILCEKPLAMTPEEVERMVAAAREQRVFLMEAMWTFFFPAMRAALDAVRAGAIGTPRLVMANFCFAAKYAPDSRLFDPNLGGGALLDLGVYPIALADAVFQVEAETVASERTLAPTGVDYGETIMMTYPNGGRALLASSFEYTAPQDALIVGDAGTIRIPNRFSQPDEVHIEIGGKLQSQTFSRQGFGYHHEARATNAYLRAKASESVEVPWEMSLRVSRTMARIQAAWKLA